MELDNTQHADEPGGAATLSEGSANERSDSEDLIDGKLAGIGARREGDVDAQQRKAMVAAGLFGAPLAAVKIGRFTVIRKLGSGGMGVVYVAYDEPLDRRVAVKLLRGAAPSVEARTRFEREAQAMARLSHPNVVTVHEVGTHESQIFVAMEFVDGQDLRGWIAAEQRGWRDVVELFRQAGEGLVAAHEAGIVHRDFKPDNVLIGNDGRVRVADFGLAHGFEHTIEISSRRPEDSTGSGSRLATELTQTGALMGTPAYMSPEQYAGTRTDARGDQFSFCVALWEGLYGQRPFSGGTLTDLSLAVTQGDFDAPPEDSEVPAWLQAIVVRGLALKPDDRWPSMRALLDAIGHDPRIRRRRVGLALALGGAALAITGLSWLAASELDHNARQRYWNDLTEQLLEIERERGLDQVTDDARRARDATRMSVVRSYKPKVGVIEREDPTLAAVLLREVETEARLGSEWISTANEILGQPISRAVLVGHRGGITSLVISPDSAWVYSASDDGEVRRWDIASGAGELIVTHDKLVSEIALSGDGQLLASSSDDGTVQLWSAATGEARVLARHDRPVTSVAFDGLGHRLASASRDGVIQIHDLGDRSSGEVEILDGGDLAINAVSFDEACARLLAGSNDSKARLWSLGEARPPLLLEGHDASIFHVRLLPDGRALTAADDGSARLWQLDGDAPASVVVARHAQAITSLDVLGSKIVTAALDGTILVSSLDPPHASIALPRHDDAVWGVRFTPDGEQVASGSFDHTAHLARSDGRSAPRIFEGHGEALYRVAIDRSGRWLATGSYDSTVRLWDLRRQPLVTPLLGHKDVVFSLSLDHAAARVVTASHDGSARVWSTRDGSLEAVLQTTEDQSSLTDAVFSPDGEHVATARVNGRVDLWDFGQLSSPEPRVLSGHQGQVWRVAFDANSERLASASVDGTARIWSVATAEELLVLRGHEAPVVTVDFDPDGVHLVTASHDGTLRIWDTTSGAVERVLTGHSSKIRSFARSPDGHMLATGSDDGTARLWPSDPSAEVMVLPGHGKDVWSVAFDPSGRRLVTASLDGIARVWDVSDGRLLRTLEGHVRGVRAVSFVGDGRVATASGDHTVRVWSPDTDTSPIVLSAHDAGLSALVALPDGTGIISSSVDGTAKLWDLDQLSADPDALLDRLRAVTLFCVPVERRIRELGDDPRAAASAFATCELARGR